jgi:hypothetical protein
MRREIAGKSKLISDLTPHPSLLLRSATARKQRPMPDD